MAEITISPGHWKIGTGARDIIDEVEEARKVSKCVVEILRENHIKVNYIEDNFSSSKSQNIGYLVTNHNKTDRNLDVSIHFNASTGRQTRNIGTEVLYYDQKELAEKLSAEMSNASGLINRGAKKRTDLSILLNTNKPAVLLEVCFVNSTEDVKLYKAKFEAICQAIAKVLAEHVGRKIEDKEMKKVEFSSNTLKDENKLTLESKERRKIIVQAAVDAGYNKSWLDKLNNNTITDKDIETLAMLTVIKTSKHS